LSIVSAETSLIPSITPLVICSSHFTSFALLFGPLFLGLHSSGQLHGASMDPSQNDELYPIAVLIDELKAWLHIGYLNAL
jgi:hypothetical protein